MSAGCPVIEADGTPCGKRIRSRGWCRTHYDRWCRHGDPTVVRKPGPRYKPNPGYRAVNNRLIAKWGKASDHPCTNCGRPAQEWSYNNGGGGKPYSANLDDYAPRCGSCHQKLDSKWPEQCSLDGEPHYAHGLCRKHYDAKRRNRVADRNTQREETR